MSAINQAIKVLRECLDHPEADDALCGLLAMQREPLTDADLLTVFREHGFVDYCDFDNFVVMAREVIAKAEGKP